MVVCYSKHKQHFVYAVTVIIYLQMCVGVFLSVRLRL